MKDHDINTPLIRAEDLCFSYDEGNTHSLKGFSISLHRGQKIAFMGPNGGGKSTFFLCLNGVLRPERGTLFYNGEAYSYKKKDLLTLRSRVGIVFQDPDDQLFSASVRQEISFGILNLGVPEKEAADEVDQVMERLGITAFSDKPTHALSGGQKKLVSIADILVMHPEIVILDEPAAALDPVHQKMVNELVGQMSADGITVIISTHDVDYAYAWADEIVLVKDGCVLSHGTPDTLLRNTELLQSTNLHTPAVLTMFDALCREGILSPALAPPRTTDALIQHLKKR